MKSIRKDYIIDIPSALSVEQICNYLMSFLSSNFPDVFKIHIHELPTHFDFYAENECIFSIWLIKSSAIHQKTKLKATTPKTYWALYVQNKLCKAIADEFNGQCINAVTNQEESIIHSENFLSFLRSNFKDYKINKLFASELKNMPVSMQNLERRLCNLL